MKDRPNESDLPWPFRTFQKDRDHFWMMWKSGISGSSLLKNKYSPQFLSSCQTVLEMQALNACIYPPYPLPSFLETCRCKDIYVNKHPFAKLFLMLIHTSSNKCLTYFENGLTCSLSPVICIMQDGDLLSPLSCMIV